MKSEIQQREATDAVFGRITPDATTLDQIHKWEQSGWYLVATRSGYDESALKLHKTLERHGEMFHYQLSGTLGGRLVPLNLYFVRDKTA